MEILSSLPNENAVLIGLAIATWLIGGNVVSALHYKRMGKPMWTVFTPLRPPFKDFNKTEWGMLGVLLVISMSFGIMAMGD